MKRQGKVLQTRKDFKMDYFDFFCDHAVHEVVKTAKGTIVMIDVCDTFDCGWEGAYAIFDEEAFRDWWDDYGDEDGIAGTPYTFENIKFLSSSVKSSACNSTNDL